MQNPAIGTLTRVEGNCFTMRLAKPDVPAQNVSGGQRQLTGQVGSFVSIIQPGVHVLATITSTWCNEEQEPSRCYCFCQPLGELVENKRFSRGISQYPVTGAEVYPVSDSELKAIFNKNAKFGFSLGPLLKYPQHEVYLDPNALFGRHLALLGQSGSGKSWTVTSLIQQALRAMPNAHIVLLDLHGEYCWRDGHQSLKAAFEPSMMRYVDARDLEIPYWLLTYAELIDLLIDRTDPKAATQIAFLREVLLTLRKQANEHLGIDRLSVDSPVYFSLKDLLLHFKKANEQQSDFGKTKGALYGQFDEFLVRLQSKLNDARYDFLFRPKRRLNSESLENLLRDFSGLSNPKRQITVIDLSPIPGDVRPVVAAQLGKLAFEFNYWNPRRMAFPLQLICEEAHAYIPRDNDNRYRGTRIAMERIAKEGRKYGVGLTVVSQRPHELSETVLSQCSNFICMRLTNPDDQIFVRSLVPESQADLVSTLSSLGRGEALVMGEAVPLSVRFQVRPPSPPPNSQDADFFNAWTSEPFELDVAQIIDRWRKQIR